MGDDRLELVVVTELVGNPKGHGVLDCGDAPLLCVEFALLGLGISNRLGESFAVVVGVECVKRPVGELLAPFECLEDVF